MSKNYIIGTRGSPLAVAQARWVKDYMERVGEDFFDLKIIETEGDQKIFDPLWQMEGKDFFVKELDRALLNGEVDLTVHSYKDLGHIRPAKISLAAITERVYGEDILLINQKTVQELGGLSSLIVGTSSPRRKSNVTRLLPLLLPMSSTLTVECKVLRGNINTRLKKLKRGEYHAIVLALAGLERLAVDPSSRETLRTLLEGLNYMILPASLFPSAAAQGALAVEVRSEDSCALQEKLSVLHHKKTAQAVKKEREILNHYGGGCHLAVGIQVEEVCGFFVRFERGEQEGRKIAKKILEKTDRERGGKREEREALKSPFFIGLPKEKNPLSNLVLSDEVTVKEFLNVKKKYPWQSSFVTSEYCFDGFAKTHQEGPVFTSGVKTWRKLAELGYWVNATGDSLGHEKINSYLRSGTLNVLYDRKDLTPLVTYSARKPERGEFIQAYQNRPTEVKTSYLEKLERVRSFFWTSYRQYELFQQQFPHISWGEEREHFCGVGKTFQEFKKHNIRVTPFLDWRQFAEACGEKFSERLNDEFS